MLAWPHIRVCEVATFYTMFQLSPVGKKAHVQVCGTTPCMLRGAEALVGGLQDAAHPTTTSAISRADGKFLREEVECLGARANALMVQIFNDTYEDPTAETVREGARRFRQRPAA